MTLKTDMQAAAVGIFDTFESMIINAIYLEESSSYAAGGNNTISTVEHSIRLIRDTRRAELTLSSDIPRDAKKYLMLVAELPIAAKTKDRIKIGTEIKSIIAVEDDPGDIVAILYVG